MNNSIFVDSSLLVEYRKNNQPDFLDGLLGEPGIRLFISQTVASEYLFYHLAIFGKKSPLALKESGAIPDILAKKDPLPFLELFSWLPDDNTFSGIAVFLMAKYNLLPNDALILAACKAHEIPALASFDPDFIAPCRGEGIRLLQTPADFEVFKQSL